MDNLVFQCGVQSDLDELAGIIHDYKITHSSIADLVVVTATNNAILKTLTGCVVGTESDMNCYPLGLVDTLCFDLDGDVIP